ncbi:MAG: hypothetical protein GY809_32175 [Planctomycetes bacterium]|nr:hypothetical protein [Planctomycetota bacterium]
MSNKGTQICLCVVVMVLVGAQTEAQERTVHVGDDWEFVVAPYLWMAGLSGDVTVKGTDSEVDAGFGDILDNLDAAFLGYVGARKGKWGFYTDASCLKLAGSGTSGALGVDVGLTSTLIEVGAVYRAYEGFAYQEGRPVATDIYFGARYCELEGNLDLSAGSDVKGDQDWVDPIVGVTYLEQMTDTFSISASGDIGGIGIGSDLTWSLELLGGWQLNRAVSLWLGYRYLDIDYDDGSGPNLFGYSVALHGPMAGASFHF